MKAADAPSHVLDTTRSTAPGAAVVITLVGAAVMMRLAGRLYAASLLSGGKLSWKEALEAEPVR